MQTFRPHPAMPEMPVPDGTEALLKIYQAPSWAGGWPTEDATIAFDDAGLATTMARMIVDERKYTTRPIGCIICTPDGEEFLKISPEPYRRPARDQDAALDAAQRQHDASRGLMHFQD